MHNIADALPGLESNRPGRTSTHSTALERF